MDAERFERRDLWSLGNALDGLYGINVAKSMGRATNGELILSLRDTPKNRRFTRTYRESTESALRLILGKERETCLIKDAVEILFDVPLEELPLLVSESSRLFRLCVNWRLKNGK